MVQSWAVRDSGTPEAISHEKDIERVLPRAPDFSQGCSHRAGAQHDVRLTCTGV